MTAVKIVRVLGASDESWEDAAQEAVRQTDKTVEDIQGIEVESWTADVEDGGLVNYKATVDISFKVHQEE